MTDRSVRFTEQFFERLEQLLPVDRLADGTPSFTDVVMFELPRIRDVLVRSIETETLPTGEPSVRLYVNVGTLVPRIAVYLRLVDDATAEVFWVDIDLNSSDD